MSQKGKRWTPDDIQTLVSNEKTKSLSVLSVMLGRTESAIKFKLCEFVYKKANETQKEYKEILNDYVLINNIDMLNYEELSSVKAKKNKEQNISQENTFINTGKIWTEEETNKLISELLDDTKTINDISLIHSRTIKSIKYQLLDLVYTSIKQNKYDIETAQKKAKFITIEEIKDYIESKDKIDENDKNKKKQDELLIEFGIMKNKIESLTNDIIAIKKHLKLV